MKYIKTFEIKDNEYFSPYEEISLKNIGCKKSIGCYYFNYNSESTGDEITIMKISEMFRFNDPYKSDIRDILYKVIIKKQNKKKRIIKDFPKFSFSTMIEFVKLYIPEEDKYLKKYNI